MGVQGMSDSEHFIYHILPMSKNTSKKETL